MSFDRDREQASAYFAVVASRSSKGTTALTKPQSYISLALNGRPVKTISMKRRTPIMVHHCHCRAAQPA